MQEENSKKMDVSYGVDKSQESADITPKEPKKSKKSTKKTKKVVAKKEKVEEPRPKKKTLIDEINEMKANNDVNSPEFREKMSKLEKILGVDEVNPFGTNEPDIFEDKIKGMTYSDMRDLAYKVGINPFMGQSELKASLLKEFNASNKNNMRNIMPTASSVVKLDPKNPKHAETLRILGEI
jgi:hypothetical protein